MQLSSLSVGRRLAAGFGAVLLAMAMVTATGIVRVQDISERLDVINDQNSVKQRYAINFRGSVHDRSIALRDVVLAETESDAQVFIDDIARLAKNYSESEVKLAAIYDDPALMDDAERTAYADIADVQTETMPIVDDVVALRMGGDVAGAKQLLQSTAAPLFTEWLRVINVMIDLEEARNQQVGAEVRSIAAGFRTTMFVLCAIGLVLAAIIARRIARTITRPIHESVKVFEAISAGDLTQRLGVEGKDEFAEMGTYANRCLGSIADTVRAVVASANEIGGATGRITRLSERIAADAAESAAQAGVVDAAAIDVSRSVQAAAEGSGQMGASIREISMNASEAAQVAGRAVDAAESTNSTVSRLGDSSRQIGDVVRAIASIAEQTNLLALNASIEAARAGEAGKGFAVVAGEVKELAQETARATADITRQVEAIQQETDGAVAAIHEVSEIIQQIHRYQTTIAAAVEEQTATTGEINRGVAEAAQGSSHIAQNIGAVAVAARSTSTSVAESLQAATELSEVSDRLQSVVSHFRL